MLIQQILRNHFNYDPKTGWFTRKVGYKHWKIGQRAGTLNSHGYRFIRVKKHLVMSEHRAAWVYIHGAIPNDKQIDHINHKRDDNRIENLQLLTQRENGRKQNFN